MFSLWRINSTSNPNPLPCLPDCLSDSRMLRRLDFNFEAVQCYRGPSPGLYFFFHLSEFTPITMQQLNTQFSNDTKWVKKTQLINECLINRSKMLNKNFLTLQIIRFEPKNCKTDLLKLFVNSMTLKVVKNWVMSKC